MILRRVATWHFGAWFRTLVDKRMLLLYYTGCFVGGSPLFSRFPGPKAPAIPSVMSTTTDQHRSQAPRSVRCAVITVSDTRTLADDRGGQRIVELLTGAGHTVAQREIVPDEPARIADLLKRAMGSDQVDAVLITGGTGIAARDQTFETVSGLLTKTLPGYGELFRMLSYDEIGPAAMLSRAIGGVTGRVLVLTMPGSPAAVELAMNKLIVPELGHLVYEARK
jgi:molybdopterin adenylyltransferase